MKRRIFEIVRAGHKESACRLCLGSNQTGDKYGHYSGSKKEMNKCIAAFDYGICYILKLKEIK